MRPGSNAATRHVVSPRVEPAWGGSAFGLLLAGNSPPPGMSAASGAYTERLAWLDLVSADRKWRPRRLRNEERGRGAESRLASGFITYLERPEHLLTRLETCVLVDRFARTFDVEIPLELPARDVGAATEEHTWTLWR